MPTFELRRRGDLAKLDELAAFKTLAVMCYPNDRSGREKVMGAIHSDIGINKSRRAPFDLETLRKEWLLHSVRGHQVGHLLLTMIQLRSHGYEPSLNLVIELQTTLLPPWTNELRATWHSESHHEHLSRSRRIILSNVRNYASVAHLWAAHMYSQQARENPSLEDLPSWPDSIEGLLGLLGHASLFWKLESSAKPPSGSAEPTFGKVKPWLPMVPEHMVVYPSLNAMPIPQEWLSIITTYRK